MGEDSVTCNTNKGVVLSHISYMTWYIRDKLERDIEVCKEKNTYILYKSYFENGQKTSQVLHKKWYPKDQTTHEKVLNLISNNKNEK